MRKLLLKVDDQFCDECSLALRRFIGSMDGVESIDVEEKKIAIVFNDSKVHDDDLIRIVTDSLEKLGHNLTEHWRLA